MRQGCPQIIRNQGSVFTFYSTFTQLAKLRANVRVCVCARVCMHDVCLLCMRVRGKTYSERRRHPNIVQLREVLASRSKIFIVLELVTGGELFDQIVKEGKFTEDKARYYFRQLVHGLEYCNSKGVCHRDLKPENLLLDGQNDLKISDFGLSALYTGGDEETASRTTLLHTTCGTPNYVAPEVLEDNGYDGRSADIWR